jgi:hypothetical protein
MKTLLALVPSLDINAFSEAPQVFSPRPTGSDAADVAQSFAPGNLLFQRPEFDFGRQNYLRSLRLAAV